MSIVKVEINHLINELTVDSTVHDIHTQISNALQMAIDNIEGKGHHITINNIVGTFNILVKEEDTSGKAEDILIRAAQTHHAPDVSDQTPGLYHT
ncbi:MAG TPA: hypothetical protein PK611_10765 [Saprospiraceae bacterium]|jgi:hypothetical protein|nr:hypothetical protein [Saprospiraceae bacterium]HRO74144.1 hypothetical protein [Saprospiraceae bacterium]HRP41968.1 hypothetical protein [Saprospiraceae bacterium]